MLKNSTCLITHVSEHTITDGLLFRLFRNTSNFSKFSFILLILTCKITKFFFPILLFNSVVSLNSSSFCIISSIFKLLLSIILFERIFNNLGIRSKILQLYVIYYSKDLYIFQIYVFPLVHLFV